MVKRKRKTKVPYVHRKRKINLPRCLKCGARSSDLSTTWPEPEFMPKPTLGEWDVDWSMILIRDGKPALENGCLVCKTIISVFIDVGKKHSCSLVLVPHYVSIRALPDQSLFLDVVMDRKTWRSDGREETKRTMTNHIKIKPLVDTSSAVQWPSLWHPTGSFPTDSGSREAFELANTWLGKCRNTHKKCASSSASFTPTRIIDIGGKDPKLVLHGELQDTIKYVALSHCWGGFQPLQTTRENLQSYKDIIPYDTLPKTFKDAVKVTKSLDLRYIWIDSLCIIQGDKEDWERESSQMEKVYGYAELVLAATVASSPEDGFLGDRSGSLSGYVTVEREPEMAPMTSAYKLRIEASHIVGVDGPLEGRAWAFQERLLAKRYLAYGVDEMRWTCRERSCCECGWVVCLPQSFNYGRNVDEILDELIRNIGYKNSWAKDIVEPYTQREITFSSDKLVALSAVAARFHSKHPAVVSRPKFEYYDGHRYGTYLAGLWLEDLNYFLTWVAERGKPQDSYAPSWSWVSVDASISYPVDIDGFNNLAEVVDTSTSKLSPMNEFGSVSNAWIKLNGKAIKADLHVGKASVDKDMDDTWVDIANTKRLSCQLDMPVVAFNFPYATGETEYSARRVHHSRRRLYRKACATYSIWLLPILAKTSRIYTLVLGRSPKDRSCFERLGLVSFYSNDTTRGQDHVKVFLSKYEDSEFTIV